MARKDSFKSEDTYRAYKQKEYERYYVSTQLYAPRLWDDWEKEFVRENMNTMLTRDIAAYLQRSIKSVEHMKYNIRQLKVAI